MAFLQLFVCYRLSSASFSANNMSEEEILRRRLLVDGDGAGDEKKLLSIYKQWTKLCTSKYDTVEDLSNDVELMKFQISQAKLNLLKTHLVIGMTSDEEKAYNSLYESIGRKIQELQEDIVKAKKDLTDAQVVRRQKMEYDAMAKLINQYPPRKEEEAKLAEIKRQLDESEQKLKELDGKIELRTKQFALLVNALYMLESVLESEEVSSVMDIGNDRLDEVSLDDSTEAMEA